jgi:hypothetical protein
MTRIITRWCSLPIALALVVSVALVAPVGAARSTGSKPRVVDAGFTFVPSDPGSTFAGDVTGAAVVENPSTKVAVDVEVTLTLNDERGRLIIDDATRLAYIAPGAEAYVPWNTTYPETKVPVEVTAKITDPGELISPREWAEDAQFELGVGEFGAEDPIPIDDVAVEFSDLGYHDSSIETAASGLASSIIGVARSVSGEELTGLDVTCAAFEGGDVVGGGHMVLPIIPEGAEAGIQASGLLGGLTPDDARCSARVEYLRARVGTLDDALTVTDAGFRVTSIDEYTMGAVIENPTDKWAWGLDVAFDVLDASGRVVGSRRTSEPLYVAPNSTVYASPEVAGSPNDFAGTPADLRVLVTAGVFLRSGRPIKDEAGFDPAAWEFEFADLRLAERGNVVGTITSRAKKPLNAVQVTCGAFAGGSIIGAAANTLSDDDVGGLLEPGEPTEIEVQALFSGLGADEFRCVATITGLSDV